MYAMSPQLSKIILAFLLLLPAFSLYIKIFWPHLAQTGFNGAAIVCLELVFSIFIGVFGKHPKVTKNGYYLIAALTCWHGLGIISALLSDHFYASLIKQIEYLVHCLFAYSAWVFLSQVQKSEKMAYFLIFTLMWVIYYILAAWHSNPDTYNYDWVRGTPMFNNIRHLGFLQIGIFPLLFLPLLSNKQHRVSISLVLLSVFWASVIWSCSRGTFSSAIIINFALILFFTHNRKLIILMSVIAFIIGWIIALQFPSESGSLNPYRLLFINIENAQLLDPGRLSSGRTLIWTETLHNMWQQSPFLGFAADGYKYVSPHIWPNTVHPHSGPVQIFSEFGIFGFIALLFIAFTCITSWKNNPGNNINKLARFGLLAIIVGSFNDGHLYYTFSLLLIACLLALSFTPPLINSQGTKKRTLTPILLSLKIVLLWPIKEHWQTYMEQQFPLTNENQIAQVLSFPSYYQPRVWQYNLSGDSKLRNIAIKFGQDKGPYKCTYFLMEYFESNNPTQKSNLLSPIKKLCANYALLDSGDPVLIEIGLERLK